jgi:hypothetical protein
MELDLLSPRCLYGIHMHDVVVVVVVVVVKLHVNKYPLN